MCEITQVRFRMFMEFHGCSKPKRLPCQVSFCLSDLSGPQAEEVKASTGSVSQSPTLRFRIRPRHTMAHPSKDVSIKFKTCMKHRYT